MTNVEKAPRTSTGRSDAAADIVKARSLAKSVTISHEAWAPTSGADVCAARRRAQRVRDCVICTSVYYGRAHGVIAAWTCSFAVDLIIQLSCRHLHSLVWRPGQFRHRCS